MESVIADADVDAGETSWLAENQTQPVDKFKSTEANTRSTQMVDNTKEVYLDANVENQEEEEKGGKKNMMSVNSGTEDNWDMVSPLLLSSSTSRVLRSRLLYDDTVNDSSDTRVIAPQFRDGVLPDFVSPQEAFLTVASGFMALSSAALVIGSFGFSWSDTMLRVHINTIVEKNESDLGPPLEFDLPLYKNATFQTTLSIFQDSKSYIIVMMVLVSSLILPSIWIMVHPILVLGVHRFSRSKYQVTHASNRNSWIFLSRLTEWWYGKICTHERIGNILTIAEIFMKFSLSIIYVQSILLVCTSGIIFAIGSSTTSITDYIDKERQDIEGDDEYDVFAQVVNRTRGGTLSYLMGISFGIAAIGLIRIHWRRHDRFLKRGIPEIPEVIEHDLHADAQSLDTQVRLQERSNSAPPPVSAFRLLNEVIGENHDVQPGANVHEETKDTDSQNMDVDTTQLFEPSMQEDGFKNMLRKKKFPPISAILLIETGIISTIFLYPMLTLPLIRLDLEGLAVPLISRSDAILTLRDIVYSVSHNSGNGFISFIASAMFWINIIISPVVSLIACLLSWALKHWETTKSLKVYNLLSIVHPHSNSTAFAISMLVTVASLNLVSNFLFNQHGFCEVLADTLLGINGEKCLVINGTLLPGFWFLLLQGLCLDIFVRTTLHVR